MLLNEVETSIKNPASLLLCDNIFFIMFLKVWNK